MVVYADDADFICRDQATIQVILNKAPAILARWYLTMNIFKTEITELRCHIIPSGHNRLTRATKEQWRSTRKFGSLRGDTEDLTRWKALVAAPLDDWLRPHYTTSKTRIRIYNSYVLPVLLYNSCTWALLAQNSVVLKASIDGSSAVSWAFSTRATFRTRRCMGSAASGRFATGSW